MSLNKCRKFLSDETGAVTVDWVVLTAGVVGMGFMVVTALIGNTDSIGQRVGSYLSNVSITSN